MRESESIIFYTSQSFTDGSVIWWGYNENWEEEIPTTSNMLGIRFNSKLGKVDLEGSKKEVR